jgi:hypothetical protein
MKIFSMRPKPCTMLVRVLLIEIQRGLPGSFWVEDFGPGLAALLPIALALALFPSFGD